MEHSLCSENTESVDFEDSNLFGIESEVSPINTDRLPRYSSSSL